MKSKAPTVRALLGLGILVIAPGLTTLGHAQPATPSVSTSPAAPPASPKPPGGPKEGIKVHGHWTIDVRNQDGSLASHTEFDNGLVSSGQTTLGALLTGHTTVSGWGLELYPSGLASNAPCVDLAASPPAPAPCLITVSAYPPGNDRLRVFRTLNVWPTPNYDSFTLSGTATVTNGATVALSIGQVWTVAHECMPGVSAIACSTDTVPWGMNGFTQHILATPIPVVTGQIVQVTVTISFS